MLVSPTDGPVESWDTEDALKFQKALKPCSGQDVDAASQNDLRTLL